MDMAPVCSTRAGLERLQSQPESRCSVRLPQPQAAARSWASRITRALQRPWLCRARGAAPWRRCYERALDLDPRSADAWVARGAAFANQRAPPRTLRWRWVWPRASRLPRAADATQCPQLHGRMKGTHIHAGPGPTRCWASRVTASASAACGVQRSPEARCGRAEVDPGDANAAKYLAATRARMQELGIAPRPRPQPDGAGAQPGPLRERASPAAARAGACESPGCCVERGIGSGAVAGLPGSSASSERRGGRPLEQTGQVLSGALPSHGRPASTAAGPSQAPDSGGAARGGGSGVQAAVPVCPPGEPGSSAARSVEPAPSGAAQLLVPHRAACRLRIACGVCAHMCAAAAAL